MPTRKADAVWNGNLKQGNGTMKFGSFEGAYSFSSRFEDGKGSNPEELIGAALAGCFSMAFSNQLDKAGFTPESVSTRAEVLLEGGAIKGIVLYTRARVPNIDEDTFQQIADDAKKGCPISKALASTPIELEAGLE